MTTSPDTAIASSGSLYAARPDIHVPAGFERNCAMGDTITLLSQPWAFLIVREAFFGARRFSDFVSRLGIPRATLSASLSSLIDDRLLETRSHSQGSAWKTYRLSQRGGELFPIYLGFVSFGDTWLTDGVPPLALYHASCRSWFSPRIVWAETGGAVDPRQIDVKLEDNYWRPRSAQEPRRRRIVKADGQMGMRACSMERLLSIVGDRWTFLILREMFHGNRSFQEFLDNLQIASNILSQRLQSLVDGGMIERPAAVGRSGYRLTAKGIDIYGPMILMKHWGDRWLMPQARPTMDFIDRASTQKRTPTVVCSCCGHTPEPLQTGYRGRDAGVFSI
ncbi:MAG: helix-turn-helix transcriptional regulator [Rhodobiaceae bacterium]|nr:helix-turn-helix transcriptional regulator [Rhodobiaceae bacterium]MCC0014132.1 helix-turn-helix transcriptional regulator [Rhodobiaceae bacterium]MCC0060470.1 helix-turn-helix transcriptional regulator [Rhodobiaceae bacterium]